MKMNFLSKIHKDIRSGNEQGFTLVETLVAVAIFAVSVAAVISVTAQGVSNTGAAKNRIIANYLAQENIEYVRHVRNKYTPATGVSASWNSFMDKIGICGQKCVVADPTEFDPANEFTICADQNSCDDWPVIYDDASRNGTGYYFQERTASPNTPFRRYIYIEKISPDEIKVISTVLWRDKNSADKNVTLTETLTNWLPTF